MTRRELFRWGLFTSSGLLAWKNGLNVYAPSAYGQVPTGTPRSPLFGARKFTQPFHRLNCRRRCRSPQRQRRCRVSGRLRRAQRQAGVLPQDFNDWKAANPDQPTSANPYCNPITKRGPMEGRPPGELFAHQRWDEFFPKVGYVLSLGEIDAGYGLHPTLPYQQPNSIWTYGVGKNARGTVPPLLIKARYGEPILTRVYNCSQGFRAARVQGPGLNRGFGRNETQLHFHNAHNGAESDGASNVHHFPGTFYDYRWSTTLARRDKINTGRHRQEGLRARRQRWLDLRRRRLPRAAGHHVGPRPPLLLHRRECLQGQCS